MTNSEETDSEETNSDDRFRRGIQKWNSEDEFRRRTDSEDTSRRRIHGGFRIQIQEKDSENASKRRSHKADSEDKFRIRQFLLAKVTITAFENVLATGAVSSDSPSL